MAIEGNIYIDLKELFELVTEEDLFKFYTGGLLPYTLANSPLRKDNNPSFIYGNINGNWIFTDFGGNKDRGSIIDFIMLKYSCSFGEAINIIYNDFKLKKRNTPIKCPNLFIGREIRRSVKKRKIITTVTEPWSDFYLDYWEEYGVTKKTLIYYNVHPISRYQILDPNTGGNKIRLTYKAYEYKLGKYSKILNVVKNAYPKWLGNAPSNVWQGTSQLKFSSNLLIVTKSLKDTMVLYECGFESIAPQSETPYIPDEILTNYINKYEKVIFLYDNDKTGIDMSRRINEKYNYPIIFMPTKDVSDFSKLYGIENTSNIINELIQTHI